MGTTKTTSRHGTSRGPTSKVQIEFSIFRHAKDSAAIPQVGTAEQIMAELAVNRTPTPGNPGGDPKRSMPAISPAIYPQGATRGYENALGVGFLALDFDNSIDEPTGENHVDSRTGKPTGRPKTRKVQIPDPVAFNAVAAQLRSTGKAFTMWSTWSCKPEWQKFRGVIFLAQPVPIDQWARASEHALTLLGLDQFRRGLDIPVLHNPCALAFMPGSPTPDTIQRASAMGDLLTIPLKDLPALPAAVLAPWQLQVVEARQIERTSGDYWFKHYRVEGQGVDFKSLDLVGLIRSLGVEVGHARPFKTGSKWRCHCPWASEHSRGEDDDSGVIYHTPGEWPSFKCSHSGHTHLGLRDICELAWGVPT